MASDDGSSSSSSNSTGANAPDAVIRAHVASLRLLLAGWITHFRSLGYVKETTMDMLDKKVCRKVADLSVRDPKAREAIGLESKVWADLVDLFRNAMPSLEHRSYAPVDPVNSAYDGPNSNAIVGNSESLLKDLQRLDNMLAMARNILTSGEKVQNLAAQVGFDREVCSMINICIKITARGYDGDGSALDEDKWQGVINGFKKLLITCLQFLSNLVTLNERLKLMLWVELFDSSPEASQAAAATSPADSAPSLPKEKDVDNWVKTAINDFKMQQVSQQQQQQQQQHPSTAIRQHLNDTSLQKISMPSAFSLWAGYERETIEKSLAQKNGRADPQGVVEALEHIWQSMPADDRARWDKLHEEKIMQIQKRFEQYTSTGGTLTAAVMEKAMVELGMIDPNKQAIPGRPASTSEPPRAVPPRQPGREPFWRSGGMNSARDGARKLHEGKLQLLRRLEHAPADRTQHGDFAPPSLPADSQEPPSATVAYRHPGPDSLSNEKNAVEADEEEGLDDEDRDEDDAADEDEEADADEEGDDDDALDLDEEDESSEEDDYAIPGEDGRGLLTDVPLILGPNEIEVLPMIIMSGIVASSTEVAARRRSSREAEHVVNMYTIRCHLLLAQENGRNLLRELLIFVAAWDLREEELYFKFMVKIMEAILLNGLMPFAYGAFKESKDIISPAQAVIMKLLTKIFHSRQGFVGMPQAAPPRTTTVARSAAKGNGPEERQRYDVQIVHCLFSEFRQNIIPQICTLIFLQGQIRQGHAHLEDFPLNLWDMERMYEGVYQYLEFFAILTDHEQWKHLMAEWQVTSELLTLLNELEVAIPKGRVATAQTTTPPPPPPPPPPPLPPPPAETPGSSEALASETSGEIDSRSAGPVPVAVERPYDMSASGNGAKHATTPSTTAQTPVEPCPGSGPGEQADLSSTPQPYPEPLHDEPADFEWRNLKKLCILVLSSLVWKSPVLQDQVRQFNGITTILACCSHDEHNPYIREHAIMCLRFLLEGNSKNQEVIKGLAEGWVDVPRRLAEEAAVTSRMANEALGTTNGETSSKAKEAEAEGKAESGEEDTVRMRSSLKVPAEVLDQQGYETFVDARGQVGLRRKESAAAAAAQVAQAQGQAAASIEELKTVHNGGKKTGLLESGGFPDWLKLVMKSMPRQ